MIVLIWYLMAAAGEIAGCFAFWTWLRLGRSPLWAVPGTFSLVFFAMTLTRVDTPAAGRAYAAYGGIYILSSLMWLWAVEGIRPDRWDLMGASMSVVGTLLIFFGPRRV